MNSRRCVYACVAMMVAVSCFAAFPDQHEHGHGRGRGHEKKEARRYYSDRGQDSLRAWYRDHASDLPPGLAKRDELPPGLERQLRVRGTLPPGLRREIHPIPEAFVEYLPPPPPDCEHVVIGGHIVLLNRKTFVVLDIMALLH